MDMDMLERLSKRNRGIDLSGGNPTVQGFASAASRFGKALVRPDLVGKQDEDLVSKLQYKMLENELTRDPLDRELKQSRIKAINAGLTIDSEGNVIKAQTPRDPMALTPGQELAKDKATKEIFETYEMNKARKGQLDNAITGSENIPKGLFGKMRIGTAKALPFTKPFLGISDDVIKDAQEMKMALTAGTLAETAYTKGAISDQEMDLFKEASANNDFNSPAVIPVLQKIRAFMDAEESGQFGAYKQNYGEDPRAWFNTPSSNPYEQMKSNPTFLNNVNQSQPRTFNSIQEAEMSGYKGPAIVQGRKAVID